MNPINEKLALIDIGNSRFKFFFDDFFYSSDNNVSLQFEFKNYLQNLTRLPKSVLLSSVNPKIKYEIINILSDFDIAIIDSNILLEHQKLMDFSEIIGMGDDRKLGLFGALRFYKPPFITVDCGTAVTINVLNSNYKCLGGVIFADIYTQAKGLSQNTALLKELDLFFDKNILGKNTEQALRIGIVKSVIFAIKGIIEEIIKDEFANKKIPIILTGGSAKIIKEGLKLWQYEFEIRKNLVIDGLYILAKNEKI